MAELVDALASGASGGNPVKVQVLSSAPRQTTLLSDFEQPTVGDFWPARRAFLLMSRLLFAATNQRVEVVRVGLEPVFEVLFLGWRKGAKHFSD